MKNNVPLLLLAALLGPVFPLATLTAAEPVREDLTKVYEAGRNAFNKGDYVKAKAAFAKVLKAKPDFDLAIIYMAQIRTAEAKWEARPRAQKIAEKSSIATMTLSKVSLADALEVVRREVEKAGGGPQAGSIALLTDLPAEVVEREVDLSVSKVSMQHFADIVGFAGGVHLAWHQQGISVTANAPILQADDPAVAATKAMQQAARDKILPQLKMEGASVAEALAWLNQQMSPGAGPLIIGREPLSRRPITLDLRHIPLTEALNSIALVSGMEVSWHPWGAGLSPKTELASATTPIQDSPVKP
jgi:hypothetical protein